MTRGNPKFRKEEIIEACKNLYEDYNFKDITLKFISEKTSFSRPSIYNYFESKEEIFLGILEKEYELWAFDLVLIKDSKDTMTYEEFAKALANSLSKRELLLKLLSTNLYDLEENTRMERLVALKKAYKKSTDALNDCILKFYKDEAMALSFIYGFFPFMFGLYPYTHLTPKQAQAIKEAGISLEIKSTYDLAYEGILKLLKE